MITDFELMAFPDHHAFTRKDIERIKRRANGRTILTTEKDATRLFDIDYKVIPIEVKFLGTNKQEDFNQNILNYVRKNKRNSCLSQGENAHKA